MSNFRPGTKFARRQSQLQRLRCARPRREVGAIGSVNHGNEYDPHSSATMGPEWLNDFARDWGVFVERVGGTKAMVAVGDDGLGGRVVPDEKERR